MNHQSRTAGAGVLSAALITTFLCVFVGGALPACAAQPSAAAAAQPSTPATAAASSPSPSATASSRATQPSSDAATTTSSYVIGPGDSLQVFVWRNPELSVTVPVRPDGKISTPLVEDMVAVGKTPTQLARDMEGVLSEYIRAPQVNIIVNQAASVFNQVRVIGQVNMPQSVPYREGMTVLDVLLAAGGLTDFAAGNRARLVRKDENGNETSRRVRLHDLVAEGRMSENFPVQPGDVLIVPESLF